MAEAQDPLAGMEEVQSKTVAFGRVGDFIKGTFTDKKLQPNANRPGEMQNVYELKAELGQYHATLKDEQTGEKTIATESTLVEAGEYYRVYGKDSMDDAMKKAKIGQVVAFKLVEIRKPSKPGNNPFKLIKTFLGEMDPEYMGENSATQSSMDALKDADLV